MATTCRLNKRQKTLSEKMLTVVFAAYFGIWFNYQNTSFLHSRHTNWYHDTANWNVHVLVRLLFGTCFIFLSTEYALSFWELNGVAAVNIFSSVNQMLRTLISLGNHLSSCWLRCKKLFHLQFSLSVWTTTLLYVASCQAQEIDEIKMSYSLNK